MLAAVLACAFRVAPPMYAPAEAVPGRPTAWAKSMIDVFSASDEVAMVRFRLHLHEPLAFKTIVLESEHTHTGRLKPLYITNALSAEEKARYNVQLINVPFGDALLAPYRSTHLVLVTPCSVSCRAATLKRHCCSRRCLDGCRQNYFT